MSIFKQAKLTVGTRNTIILSTIYAFGPGTLYCLYSIINSQYLSGVPLCRYQEYCKLWDIDLEEELKLTEILYANKIKRHQKLVAFLKTSTGPTLYWLPAKHDEKTKGLLAEEGEKYKEWKV